MARAERAHIRLEIWDGVSVFPQSAPDKITAIAGMEDGVAALEAMGLARVPKGDVA